MVVDRFCLAAISFLACRWHSFSASKVLRFSGWFRVFRLKHFNTLPLDGFRPLPKVRSVLALLSACPQVVVRYTFRAKFRVPEAKDLSSHYLPRMAFRT